MKYIRGKPLEPGEKRAIVSVKGYFARLPALGRTSSRRTFEKPNFKKLFIVSYEIFKSTFSFANIYNTALPALVTAAPAPVTPIAEIAAPVPTRAPPVAAPPTAARVPFIALSPGLPGLGGLIFITLCISITV